MTLDYANPKPPQPISAWAAVIAAVGPTLLLAPYIVFGRGAPWQHTALLDWIALIVAIAIGLPFMWKARRGRPRSFLLVGVYALAQLVWLFAFALVIASNLERA